MFWLIRELLSFQNSTGLLDSIWKQYLQNMYTRYDLIILNKLFTTTFEGLTDFHSTESLERSFVMQQQRVRISDAE